jgi:hypothetical protein
MRRGLLAHRTAHAGTLLGLLVQRTAHAGTSVSAHSGPPTRARVSRGSSRSGLPARARSSVSSCNGLPTRARVSRPPRSPRAADCPRGHACLGLLVQRLPTRARSLLAHRTAHAGTRVSVFSCSDCPRGHTLSSRIGLPTRARVSCPPRAPRAADCPRGHACRDLLGLLAHRTAHAGTRVVPSSGSSCSGLPTRARVSRPPRSPRASDCPRGHACRGRSPRAADCPRGHAPQSPHAADCPRGHAPRSPRAADCPRGHACRGLLGPRAAGTRVAASSRIGDGRAADQRPKRRPISEIGKRNNSDRPCGVGVAGSTPSSDASSDSASLGDSRSPARTTE